MKPRLLDLFCGAGGAATGYHRAGFDVMGVDINPQPNYPYDFVQADALEWLFDLLDHEYPVASVDAIHASPPCQRFSTAPKRNGTPHAHPDLIGPTRDLLHQTGLPYVIENVVQAPLEGHVLCGTMFGLHTDGHRLRRHRLFETSFEMMWPQCQCHADNRPFMDVTGGGPTTKPRTDGGGGRPYKGTADQARQIMGIDWMTKTELNEAIPPAYTQFIGAQLLAQLKVAA